ncbi:hypothetical protein Anae109_4045 [Anaeromyxobacter sp. Fw109-5]|nr:hypothetical protein Anae109_4045 [Anaeromyxobacter sp. Fw109-5]
MTDVALAATWPPPRCLSLSGKHRFRMRKEVPVEYAGCPRQDLPVDDGPGRSARAEPVVSKASGSSAPGRRGAPRPQSSSPSLEAAPFCAEDSGWDQPSSSRGSRSSARPLASRRRCSLASGCGGRSVPSFFGASAIAHLHAPAVRILRRALLTSQLAPARRSGPPSSASRNIANALV